MGRLHSIEVENFKSYAGRQVLGPFSALTCVVGPNGAGKSNLMDAISFVVGIKARHMRSDKLQNLIFHGSGASQPTRAMVKLVYHLFECEDDAQPTSVVSFSRSITARGNSAYQIEDRHVSYADYVKELAKIGVMVEARNFLIFQGDVESIAQMSPAELSKMIDDMSGASAFAKDFDRLKAQKGDVDRATALAFQKRKGFVAEKRQVREQKDEAERFEAIQREVAELKTTSFLHRLLHTEREIEASETAQKGLKDEQDEALARTEAFARGMRARKKEQAKAQQSVMSASRKMETLQQTLKGHAPQAIRVTERLRKLRKSLKNFDAAARRIQLDVTAKSERLEQLRAEKSGLEQEHRELEANLAKLSTGDASVPAAQRAEFLELKGQAQTACVVERRRLDTLQRQRLAQTEHIQEIEGELEALRRRTHGAEDEVAQAQARLIEVEARLVQADADEARLRDEISQLQIRAQEDASNVDAAEARLQAVKGQLLNRREVRRQSRKQKKMTECIETLIGLFPGVYGRLVDICKPAHRKYHTAVATAAGKIMDHIVVDTTKTGVACIDYMRQQRVGTASFIPLDSIRTEPIRERLRNIGSDFPLCYDVILCEDDVRKAVLYAVGNTIISPDLDQARHICFDKALNVRSVTLDGHMISRSGAMTGGNAGGSESRGDRWDNKEFEALRKERNDLEERVRRLSNRRLHAQALEHLQIQLSSTAQQMASAQEDRTRLVNKVEQARQQLGMAEEARRARAESVSRFTTARDGMTTEITSLLETIEAAENDVYARLAPTVDVARLRAHDSRSLREKEALEKERELKNEKLLQLAADISYEASRNLERPLAKVERQRKEAREALVTLEEELRTVDAARTETTAALEALAEQTDDLKSVLANQRIATDALRRRQADQQLELRSLERKILVCDSELERLVAKHRELLQEAEVAQVHIPILEDDAASSQLSTQDPGAGILGHPGSVDFAALEGGPYRDPGTFDKLQAKLAKDVASRLSMAEQLQPNLRAVQRFEDVSERLKSTTDEFDDAKEASRAVSAAFDDIRRQRHDAFMECFNHVGDALKETYKDLTKSSKHPMGGNAYLTLENVDEPYLGGIHYNAMPPMKRFRDIEQLSGGEKTVAALGLLFAIHSFRPAPFFVMDEIDAALDNVNVKKVCHFVCQRRRDFQSIIITHKDQFFRQADALCGIARDAEAGSSVTYTLNLEEYPE